MMGHPPHTHEIPLKGSQGAFPWPPSSQSLGSNDLLGKKQVPSVNTWAARLNLTRGRAGRATNSSRCLGRCPASVLTSPSQSGPPVWCAMSTTGRFLLGQPATPSGVPEPFLKTGLPHQAGPGCAAARRGATGSRPLS